MMQSAISWGVSIRIFLVQHEIAIFFTEDDDGKSMACHRTFSKQSPPMPNFNG